MVCYKYCRRILDFKESHSVKIDPYIDYRFSISLRDEQLDWSPFVSREYQYGRVWLTCNFLLSKMC